MKRGMIGFIGRFNKVLDVGLLGILSDANAIRFSRRRGKVLTRADYERFREHWLENRWKP